MSRTWHVYMVECAGGRIYTGIALDVAARFEMHRDGRGAAFTRINPPIRVLAARPCASHGDAAREECSLKRLRRAGKVAWSERWPWKPEPGGQ